MKLNNTYKIDLSFLFFYSNIIPDLYAIKSRVYQYIFFITSYGIFKYTELKRIRL